MAIEVGSGEYRYRIVEDWAKLPDGWSFKEVGAVGVDKNDNVYVFNRGEHPVIVFDRDGNFLRSWGPTTRSTSRMMAAISCANARSTARCCSSLAFPESRRRT
jgi:hypothetical protein